MTKAHDGPISAEWETHFNTWIEEVKLHAKAPGVGMRYIEGCSLKSATKNGANIVCCSPLRPDKTPSFYVYPKEPCWHDYGSNETGDVFQFARLLHNCSIREAFDHVAAGTGFSPSWEERKAEIKGLSPHTEAIPEDAEKWMMDVWSSAHIAETSVFEALTWLMHRAHDLLPPMAREHLRNNYGFTDAFIDEQKIGYVPENFVDLIKEVYDCPYTDRVLASTGFFHQHRTAYHRRVAQWCGDDAPEAAGSLSPQMTDRIVFAYWKDGQARYVIGRQYFGRGTKDDVLPEWNEKHQWAQGKYVKLNMYREGREYVSQYVKNTLLWGEDSLRNARGGTIWIVEGITDAAMLAMIGIPVISPVTVAFAQHDVEHVLALLKKAQPKRVVICNDNDTTVDKRTGATRHPGWEGAKKMALTLHRANYDVHVVTLPRAEGASKIDVNEYGTAIIRAALPDEDAHALARTAFETLGGAAPDYPAALLRDLPTDPEDPRTRQGIEDIAALVLDKDPFVRSALREKIVKHVKGPRIPTRDVFNAVLDAHDKKTEAEGGPAGGAPKKARDASKMRGFVFYADGALWREGSKGNVERISNFAFIPTHRVMKEGGPDWIRGNIVVPYEGFDAGTVGAPTTRILHADYVFSCKALHTARNFKAELPDLCFFSGGDEDVQGLGELFVREHKLETLPRIQSTSQLGLHFMPDESLRWVLPAGTMTKDGWMAEPDLVLLNDGAGSLMAKLPKRGSKLHETDTPELRAHAKLFCEHAFALNRAETMATILGWWTATLFTPHLRPRLAGSPHLNVFATQSSGKSSVHQNVIWPIFSGVTDGTPNLIGTTFSIIREMSSATSLVSFFDELRLSERIETFYRLLRTGYTGGVESRGRADQGVNAYRITTPVIVCGEVRISGDAATVSRCVQVGLDGNYLTKHPESVAAYQTLCALPNHELGPFMAHWSLNADWEAALEAGTALVKTTLAKLGRSDVAERMRSNLVWVATGLHLFHELAASVGATLPEVSFSAIAHRVMADGAGENPDDVGVGRSGYAMTNVCHLVVRCATGSQLNIVKEGRDYREIGGLIHIALGLCEPQLAKWAKECGMAPLSINLEGLRRTAREMAEAGNTYVVSANKQVAFGEMRIRCLVIDPTKIPDALDCPSFAVESPSTWGGHRPASDAAEVARKFGSKLEIS